MNIQGKTSHAERSVQRWCGMMRKIYIAELEKCDNLNGNAVKIHQKNDLKWDGYVDLLVG